MTDGVHDMGGMHGFGPVVVPGGDAPSHEPWELRVFALSTIVGIEGLGSASGRALREEMEPAHYLAAGYFERWLWSTERRLLRKGTIETHEVDAWVERLERGEDAPVRRDPQTAARIVEATTHAAQMRSAPDARFTPGDAVRVRRMRPEGHTRCPRYVRGVVGRVDAVRGIDTFPDVGPYAGPPEPVYSVSFSSDDLFGASPEGSWTVVLDLFDSYLEPA